MRDPNRINRALEALRYYWEKNPDLRLGQLINNAVAAHKIYYIEEEDLILALVSIYEGEIEDIEELRERLSRWLGYPVEFEISTQKDEDGEEATWVQVKEKQEEQEEQKGDADGDKDM